MQRFVYGSIACLTIVAMACGSKDPGGDKVMDAGVTDAGGAGSIAPPIDAAQPLDAGMRGDAIAPEPVDAGPRPCGERALRCNGQCISQDTPIAGNCVLWAHVDGVSDMAIGHDHALYAGSLMQGLEGERSLHRVPAGGGAPVSLTEESYSVDHILVEDDTLYFLTRDESSPVRNRRTGSIGLARLPDGPVELAISRPSGSRT
jgi:hypothetical protein